MDRNLVVRLVRSVAAGVLTWGLVSSAFAGVQPSTGSVSITVFADHYIFAGRVFDDLDLLETNVKTRRVRAVRVDACGPGVTRALMAIVHRFRSFPVQMRVLEPEQPECSSMVGLATSARERIGQRPRGIDDEAVARYWRDLIP